MSLERWTGLRRTVNARATASAKHMNPNMMDTTTSVECDTSPELFPVLVPLHQLLQVGISGGSGVGGGGGTSRARLSSLVRSSPLSIVRCIMLHTVDWLSWHAKNENSESAHPVICWLHVSLGWGYLMLTARHMSVLPTVRRYVSEPA